MVMNLAAFAAEHYPELAGKTIPAGVLLAYVFREHQHPQGDDGPPVVDSAALERFIREHAGLAQR